jgi:hypothetical protein
VNVCDGGAGLPAERAGGTGTSEKDFPGGESAGCMMPSPALSCAAAVVVDDVRSGWLIVGVVGAGTDLSDRVIDAAGFNAEALSESPRVGRSTTRSVLECELKDDPDVSGESCPAAGGEAVKSGSMSGRLNRADISTDTEGELCWACCICKDSLDSESLRLASAFLFLGTSCSLKGSAIEDGAGEACWLRDRSGAAGESATSFLFRNVSTRLSDGCLPFSWYAICGLAGRRLSVEPDREPFSFNASR